MQRFNQKRGYARVFTQMQFFLEPLEPRLQLTATLALSASQTISPGSDQNINPSTGNTAEMMTAVDPTDPLRIMGISAFGGELYRSEDGGSTWEIAMSFGIAPDPSIAFDANGVLYVCTLEAEEEDEEGESFILLRRSLDKGDSFTPFEVAADPENDYDKPMMATGLDPHTGNQAIYITYRDLDGLQIKGSNDQGVTWVHKTVFEHVDLEFPGAGHPAVTEDGKLFVGYARENLDSMELEAGLWLDRDLDGMWNDGPNDSHSARKISPCSTSGAVTIFMEVPTLRRNTSAELKPFQSWTLTELETYT